MLPSTATSRNQAAAGHTRQWTSGASPNRLGDYGPDKPQEGDQNCCLAWGSSTGTTRASFCQDLSASVRKRRMCTDGRISPSRPSPTAQNEACCKSVLRAVRAGCSDADRRWSFRLQHGFADYFNHGGSDDYGDRHPDSVGPGLCQDIAESHVASLGISSAGNVYGSCKAGQIIAGREINR